jgi:hypothetical protein
MIQRVMDHLATTRGRPDVSTTRARMKLLMRKMVDDVVAMTPPTKPP